ncbi:MAG: efflux RND transporter permease subunit, partial [Spirochaetota bacterium]|nr:efflux RND transporter permease subunit [Spirochaetota bacterium]
QRVVYVQGGIAGRDTQSILTDIREVLADLKTDDDTYIHYSGVFEEQKKAYSDLFVGIIMAVMLVYMVMAAQFESFKAPFVIMLTVPLAFSGVILVFFIGNIAFDVQAFIGSIMLTGIVVNNSIVLVDFIGNLRENSSLSLTDAIIEAGKLRLKPILMTSMTTILALIPLAIGIGEGSELQKTMALAVIGGLSYSTLISLFLIPCIYLLFFRSKSEKS